MSTKKAVKKVKNVLIISTSFRPNSNSHALCQEVAKGVKAAGNKAEVIRLKDKKIGFCTGCYACQKLGKCVIQDDANAIVEKICKADAVQWECSGTFNGEAPFADIQPNGRRFTTTVMNFYSFDLGGKIYKDVAATGIAGILQDIGAIP